MLIRGNMINEEDFANIFNFFVDGKFSHRSGKNQNQFFTLLSVSSKKILSSASTAWKVSKYGFFSGSYFPVFGLNTGKYGPEKTPYLNTFHAMLVYNTIKSKQHSCMEYFDCILDDTGENGLYNQTNSTED